MKRIITLSEQMFLIYLVAILYVVKLDINILSYIILPAVFLIDSYIIKVLLRGYKRHTVTIVQIFVTFTIFSLITIAILCIPIARFDCLKVGFFNGNKYQKIILAQFISSVILNTAFTVKFFLLAFKVTKFKRKSIRLYETYITGKRDVLQKYYRNDYNTFIEEFDNVIDNIFEFNMINHLGIFKVETNRKMTPTVLIILNKKTYKPEDAKFVLNKLILFGKEHNFYKDLKYLNF